MLPKKEWDEIRHRVYWEADHECVVCGARHRKLHAHEVWAFDDKKKIQKLIGIECCCALCHDVHHFGRASQVYSKNYQNELMKHWCEVNGLTPKDFQKHLADIHAISRKRADIYYIVKVGRGTLS